ncbi:hypothetical protein WEI85_31455 [Actinomycetes bacterium KLBMP 9797]
MPARLGEDMDLNSDREAGDSPSPDWPDDWEAAAYPDRDAVLHDSDGEIEDIDDNQPPEAVEPQDAVAAPSTVEEGTHRPETSASTSFDHRHESRHPAPESGKALPLRHIDAPTITPQARLDSPRQVSWAARQLIDAEDAIDEPQDAHASADRQGPPDADRPPTRPDDLDKPPSLLDVAQEHMSRDDREFIREQLKKFVRSKDQEKRQEAARKIRIRAATVIANAIASDITERNRWRAYRQDPYAFLRDSPSDQAPTDQAPTGPEEKEPRTFAERLVDAMEELIAVVVKEVLIELAMPGAHIILPPTGLFDAIFTAGALLEAADHAH